MLSCPAFAADLSPRETVRQFMRAVYSNDRVAFGRLIVPHTRSERLLGKQPFTSAERARIAEEASRLEMEQLGEFRWKGKAVPSTSKDHGDGTTVRYLTSWRGTPMVVSVVKREGSWRVDLRWWLAMIDVAESPEPRRGAPEFAIKALLTTVLIDNRADAKQFLVPGSDVSLLFRGARDEPEPSDHLLYLAMEMPLVEVAPGEHVQLLDGAVVECSPSEDERILVGHFGPKEVAFVVRRVGGEWRVVAQPYAAFLSAQ